MADVVTSQLMINGPRNLIFKFTNESDGTGESGVVKVDGTSTTIGNRGIAPGIHLKVARIIYDVKGMQLRIQWVASSPTDMWIASGFGTMDWTYFGGLPNPDNTGANGQISFTTVGATSGANYSITMEMLKCV